MKIRIAKSIKIVPTTQKFEYHKTISSSQLATGTQRHYETTKKYLFDFLAEQKHTEEIKIKRIDYKFIVDFELYIRTKNGNDPTNPIDNQDPELLNSSTPLHKPNFYLLHLQSINQNHIHSQFIWFNFCK